MPNTYNVQKEIKEGKGIIYYYSTNHATYAPLL